MIPDLGPSTFDIGLAGSGRPGSLNIVSRPIVSHRTRFRAGTEGCPISRPVSFPVDNDIQNRLLAGAAPQISCPVPPRVPFASADLGPWTLDFGVAEILTIDANAPAAEAKPRVSTDLETTRKIFFEPTRQPRRMQKSRAHQ
jgi:hypothetical protein